MQTKKCVTQLIFGSATVQMILLQTIVFHNLSKTVLATCKISFLHVPRVPRTVSERKFIFMFLGLSWRKFRVLAHPARLGTKGADLRGRSNTNCYQIQICVPLSCCLFWYRRGKITNLLSESWLKGKLKSYKLAFPSCYRHPNEASDVVADRRGEVGGWGRVPFSRNLMSPTPRRKWYLMTGRRAH